MALLKSKAQDYVRKEFNDLSEQDMSNKGLSGIWHGALGLNVTGANAVEFLQGYLTCNLDRLNHTSTVPMSLCNLKGRVIVSGWVYQHAPDHLELIVHESLTQKLSNVLAPYARFSRCDLEISSEPPHVEVDQTTGVRFSRNGPDDDVGEQVLRHLVESRFAWLTSETSERFLPQVLDLHNQGAVDFDKGCYLGQEIVARAQFRGSVKKELVAFSWVGDSPEPGAENADGHIVISVTSSQDSTNEGTGLAIA